MDIMKTKKIENHENPQIRDCGPHGPRMRIVKLVFRDLRRNPPNCFFYAFCQYYHLRSGGDPMR